MMLSDLFRNRRWRLGLGLAVAAVVAALILGGGGAGDETPLSPTVGVIEQGEPRGDDHASAKAGCDQSAGHCSSERGRSDGGPGSSERQAGTSDRQPEAPAEGPKEPADHASEPSGEGGAGGDSPANVNPDHYGPGGEPSSDETLVIEDGKPTKPDPANVNPDE